MTTHYDILTIGSGEATKLLSWTFGPHSKFGLKTAAIERQWKGGSCPNVACLPSKNVIFSAHAVHESRLGTFGLRAMDSSVDVASVKARKNRMVEGLMATHDTNFKNSGAELIWGEGKFVAPKEIEVTAADGTKKTYTADTIVIGTGSRSIVDDKIPGLKESEPLTHVEWLDLEVLPEKLIVLGGGYVGLEMSQASARLGSKVTVVERGSKILKNEDDDVTSLLTDILSKEGVDILAGWEAVKVEGRSGSSVKVTIKSKAGAEKVLEGTHILAAAGRIPNTDNLGLEVAGVKIDSKGHIVVDEQLRTTAPGIFAVGDCAGSPYFTHMGYDDFRIVKSVLAKDPKPRSRVGRQVPYTLFTEPEIAHVGMHEHEAKERKIKHRLFTLPTVAILRSRTMDETVGFIKTVIAEDDTILGFTAMAPRAGDMLPVVQLAMAQKLSYKTVADLIMTHPTMAEGICTLYTNVPEK